MGTNGAARRERSRRESARRERKLIALADRQHGVICKRQLIECGLSLRTIGRRIHDGRLHPLYQGVYAYGSARVGERGHWMAAVLACDEGTVLSHRSAARLWGLVGGRRGQPEVTAARGRKRAGLRVHQCGIDGRDRTTSERIPVTTVARTLFDLAEVEDEDRVFKAAEEADRLGLLSLAELDAVCVRGHGRRSLRTIRAVIDEARAPDDGRTTLEQMLVAVCREFDVPPPTTNVSILGHEVDAYWPQARLAVEADGFAFHRHRAAFERDRARDAAMQVEGYRVVRYTKRRLEREPAVVADELHRLIAPAATPDGEPD